MTVYCTGLKNQKFSSRLGCAIGHVRLRVQGLGFGVDRVGLGGLGFRVRRGLIRVYRVQGLGWDIKLEVSEYTGAYRRHFSGDLGM